MNVRPADTRIGWIGTGVMGRSMCCHLIDLGYAVTVFNRTKSKAQPLLAKGARWADCPRAVAEQSDIVFTIVGFPSDVREVYFGDDGVLAGCKPGDVQVDMTTSAPRLSIEIAEQAAGRQSFSLDAPVSGGDVGAREARLSIMVGGDRQIFECLQPCWDALGKTIVYHGGSGAGQQAKLVNQILIANNMVGVCEALLYGHKAGLDLGAVLQSVASGAAGSWSLSNLGPRILANQFDPGFFVEHFVKDLGIAISEAGRMELALPGLSLAHQLYVALQAQGHGRSGTHALQLALASLSQVEWQRR